MFLRVPLQWGWRVRKQILAPAIRKCLGEDGLPLRQNLDYDQIPR
jgi:hypothetical protein